ncbi:MAG: type IX secretion system protein PorQ [Bacteroidales bacterium]|nr:type IX secretion system protein PorQ [Bacteroidales bacterium]
MIMRSILLVTLLLFPLNSSAQVGGGTTYGFLNLTTSARSMALGTKSIAINDDDLNLVYYNPALLNQNMEHHLGLNYVKYFGGINYGYVAYSPGKINKYNVSAGLHYLNYGEFQGADERGVKTGAFRASEYALNVTSSRPLDSNFMVGVHVKPVYSQLEEYKSLGVAADIGLLYTDSAGLFSAALLLENIGTQIIPYTPNEYESLPFEIQIGASLKLKHAPFRFIVVAEHLEKPDLTFNRPEETTLINTYYQGDLQTEGLLDKVMRHMIFGVEFTPLDNFYLRAGYHYRRRQEMKVESKISTVGFSWGFGIRIFKFYLNYGRGTYHLAGGTNHFSLRVNLNEF